MTVNSSQEDTGELVSVARVLRQAPYYYIIIIYLFIFFRDILLLLHYLLRLFMFREAGRVRGPDQDARRSLVSNIINVCANMEGKEVRGEIILV